MKTKIFFPFMAACLLCVLALSGCGNNGDSPGASQPGLQPPPPPDPVVSAEVEQVSAQVLWQNYSKVYFIGTVQSRNTGTADLENVYYRIEGSRDNSVGANIPQPWELWSFIAVTPPFSLSAGAVAAGSYEFNYYLDTILQQTGVNYPKEYPVRFRLCLPDGTPLSSMTAIVYIP